MTIATTKNMKIIYILKASKKVEKGGEKWKKLVENMHFFVEIFNKKAVIKDHMIFLLAEIEFRLPFVIQDKSCIKFFTRF